MFLQTLNLLNFRNHAELNLSFNSRFIVITGNNGTGKTNLLDAIHYLSMGKSYFHFRDEIVLKEGETAFMVSGVVEINSISHEIKASFSKTSEDGKSKKNIFRNDKAIKTLSEHIGFFPVVVVCPQDMEIITGTSDLRRKFVNEILCQTDREYLSALTNYKKILGHRNQYLKSLSPTLAPDSYLLEVYNNQLCEQARVILNKRDEWVLQFVEYFKECYGYFTPSVEWPSIRWKRNVSADEMNNKLERNLQRDRMLGYTSAGPHKDELLFFLDAKPLKHVASQGQQKSFLLALKMARHKFIHASTGKTPPLLLDDIYDKLDEKRLKSFMTWLKNQEQTQVFITDTNVQRMQKICLDLELNADFLSTNDEINSFTQLSVS